MPVYKDKKGKWLFRTSVDGRQYKRTGFDTKREATESEAEFRTNFKNDSNPKTRRIKFEDAVTLYMSESEKKLKVSSLSTYNQGIQKHMMPIFKGKEINKISKQDINAWRKYLDDNGYNPKYKNKLLTLIRNIFKYSNVQYKTNNMLFDIEPPFKSDLRIEEKKQVYSIDEFKKFIASVDVTMYKAFFTILFFTGMRVGEIRALTWNDIDIENATVSITKSMTSKANYFDKKTTYIIQRPKTNSSIRVINYPKHLVNDTLIDYKNQVMQRVGFKQTWFVFGDTYPLGETTIRRFKNKYARKSKLPQIRIHDFRHSYVSMLHELGVDVIITKDQVGHSDINTTVSIYTHLDEKKKKAAINDAFSGLK